MYTYYELKSKETALELCTNVTFSIFLQQTLIETSVNCNMLVRFGDIQYILGEGDL